MKGGKFYKHDSGDIYYLANDLKKENFVKCWCTDGRSLETLVHFSTLTPISDEEETKILEQINFNDLFNNK